MLSFALVDRLKGELPMVQFLVILDWSADESALREMGVSVLPSTSLIDELNYLDTLDVADRDIRRKSREIRGVKLLDGPGILLTPRRLEEETVSMPATVAPSGPAAFPRQRTEIREIDRDAPAAAVIVQRPGDVKPFVPPARGCVTNSSRRVLGAIL
jgi:hypothetical protein